MEELCIMMLKERMDRESIYEICTSRYRHNCWGAIRSVCEVLGIQDVVAKSLGSANPHNVLKACVNGLRSQILLNFYLQLEEKKYLKLFQRERKNNEIEQSNKNK